MNPDWKDRKARGKAQQVRLKLPRVLLVQPVLPSYRVPVFAGLVKRGFAVTCWSDHEPRTSLKHVDPGGLFETGHRRERAIGPFLSQPCLIEAARSRAFDVLIFPWNVRYLELVPAMALARGHNLPCLLWGHARSKRERPAIRRVRDAIGRAATACITYDTGAQSELLLRGFEPARVFTAQNAVDHERCREAGLYWAERPLELAKFQAQEQIAQRPLVLFVSRLEPDKHIDILLRSFAQVVLAAPSARLAIIGDGPAREFLTAEASSLGLTEKVHFVGALHDELRLSAWFSSAQVFAYPTNIGLSLLHSFSYGLPVVTSDRASEHNPEFFALRPGENGLVYRSNDESDFADQILRCLQEPELQARLSKGARDTVERDGGYNLKAMLDGMESALRYALGQRRDRLPQR